MVWVTCIIHVINPFVAGRQSPTNLIINLQNKQVQIDIVDGRFFSNTLPVLSQSSFISRTGINKNLDPTRVYHSSSNESAVVQGSRL